MNKKEHLALILFVFSLFFIGFLFFSQVNTQVLISINGDQNLVQQVPSNYSQSIVLFIIFLTSIASMSFMYYLTGMSAQLSLSRKEKLTLAILEGDEKKVYSFLLEYGGEIVQKDLVYQLKLPKTKVTRILDKLEHKKILSRISYGNTNKIILRR